MTWTYADRIPPEWYSCSRCGRSRIKLWRTYNTIPVTLFCTGCMKYASQVLVSAVPVEGTTNYWGITNVPNAGVGWWNQLPQE